MGINPLDGKLGCPHIACCYLGEIPATPAQISAKYNAALHKINAPGKLKKRILWWCGFAVLSVCFLVWVRITFDILHAMR